MTLSDLRIADITRITAHTVHPKTSEASAYATHSDQCLSFTSQEKGMLIGRLYEALRNSKKTFELSYDDLSSSSIHSFVHSDSAVTDEQFLTETQGMTDKLASVHFRTNIPGGYCLYGEGLTADRKTFFFVIKAELQEVFTINRNTLEIIQNVFLSPAKELHKIGFFLNESGDIFTPYMYDDQFSMQKKDLTEYFYSGFLGLTTGRNDSIKSKNFYKDTKEFIDDNVSNVQDRIGLYGALTTLFREDSRGVISAREFSDLYLEDGLKNKFDLGIVPQYPQSFTKDISLFERTLQMERISIPLTYSTKIVGTLSTIDEIEIIENPETIEAWNNSIININNRRTTKMVLISRRETAI